MTMAKRKKHFLTKIATELPIWCPVFNSHMLSCGAFISGVYGLFKAKGRSTFARHIPVALWSLYPSVFSPGFCLGESQGPLF